MSLKVSSRSLCLNKVVAESKPQELLSLVYFYLTGRRVQTPVCHLSSCCIPVAKTSCCLLASDQFGIPTRIFRVQYSVMVGNTTFAVVGLPSIHNLIMMATTTAAYTHYPLNTSLVDSFVG